MTYEEWRATAVVTPTYMIDTAVEMGITTEFIYVFNDRSFFMPDGDGYHVTVGNEMFDAETFDEAARWLWEAHAQYNYG